MPLNLLLVKDHLFQNPHFSGISGPTALDCFTALAICNLICKVHKTLIGLYPVQQDAFTGVFLKRSTYFLTLLSSKGGILFPSLGVWAELSDLFLMNRMWQMLLCMISQTNHQSIAASVSWITSSGKASCHFVRMRKQLYRKAHGEKN